MDGASMALDDMSIHIVQQEISELQTIEANLKVKSDELTQQLKGVQKDLDAAHNSMATKECQIKERKNMLKPVVALPPEILSMIFLRVESNPAKNTYQKLLMLSSICRRWRSVVIGNPELWRRITLQSPHRYNLELILSRSADLGLDIGISRCWNPSDKTMIQLGRAAHRWERLRMDVSNMSDGFLSPASQKRAKSLISIQMVHKWGNNNSEGIRPAFAVRQNNLRTAVLIRVPMFKALVAPNLQHFAFIGNSRYTPLTVSSDHLWRILSPTTNLRILRLGVDSITFAEPMKTILLPTLHHLTIYFESGDLKLAQLVKLLDMIAAPALQAIEFTADENICIGKQQDDFWDLALCRKQRYPLITTVTLYGVLRRPNVAKWFIKAFPHTKDLTMDSQGLANMSASLAEFDPPQQNNRWEALECIRMHVRHVKDITDSEMEDLHNWLECRQSQGLPLARLELVVRGVDGWSWLDPLREYSLLTVVKPPVEDFVDSSRYWLR